MARELFKRTNAEVLANSLHPHGEAPQMVGQTRLQAIDIWMKKHSRPSAYAILDDAESGASLLGSLHDRAGRLFLCAVGRGFTRQQVPGVLRALIPQASQALLLE